MYRHARERLLVCLAHLLEVRQVLARLLILALRGLHEGGDRRRVLLQLELRRDAKLDTSDRDGGHLERGCGGGHATVEPTRVELDEDGSGEVLRLAVHRMPCPLAQVSEHSESLPALAAAAFLVAGRGPRGHVEAFIGHAHPLCHILQNQLGDLAVGARGSRNGECHLERHLG